MKRHLPCEHPGVEADSTCFSAETESFNNSGIMFIHNPPERS